MKRKIVKIDEDKCNGCGVCIPSCHEGAIKIVDGKARLAQDALCDGLGACLGECPEGAISIEERDAEAFSEEAVLKAKDNKEQEEPMACGCPGSMIRDFRSSPSAEAPPAALSQTGVPSALQQWPVQLKLLNARAPFFKNADLLVAADCTAFSFGSFHQRFLKNKVLVVFCPKLDEGLEEYVKKLTEIFKEGEIRSITVVRMEVPCCAGTLKIVEEALRRSGKNILMKEYTLSLQGEII